MNVIHNWIVVLANGYMEYADFRNHCYYRRTVDYANVVWC